MLLKVFVVLGVLKLAIGSLECCKSNVKEQRPYHQHDNQYDNAEGTTESGSSDNEHGSTERVGVDSLASVGNTEDNNTEIKTGNIFGISKSGKVNDEKVENSTNIETESKKLNGLNKDKVKSDSESFDFVNEHVEREEALKYLGVNTHNSCDKENGEEGLPENYSDVHDQTPEANTLLMTSGSDSNNDGKHQQSEMKNVSDNSPQFAKRISHSGDFNAEQDLRANCDDCDLRLLPVQSSDHQESTFKKESYIPAATIQFSEIPEGEKMLIESFGLTEGLFVFGYLGEFISYIQPHEFPVGLLRDALQNQITLVSLITESLKLEVGFLVILSIGIVLALAVPCVVLSHTCYRMRKSTSESPDMADNEDIVIGWAGNCRRRTLVFILQLLLLLLIAGVLVMFVTNEQLSSAMYQSSKVLLTALGDLRTFLHNSHLQLHFVMTRSLDQALQACYADLDNVGTLLGRPIQEELILETGLDVALTSLDELSEETRVTVKQVEDIMTDARGLQEVLVNSRDKLADLRHQVDMFRRQCPPRDRTLCDTINASGLDVNLRLDRIRGDQKLNRIRQLGGTDMAVAVRDSRDHFDSVPLKVESDTRDARQVVRRQLSRQRSVLDDNVRTLEQFTRNVANKVNDASRHLAEWFHNFDEVEFWRWIVSGSAAVSVFTIWILLLSGISCGCCGSEKSVGPTLLGSIVLICLVSTALWAIALVGFLIGGHGEVFVCRPLYDEPEYTALSRLLDEPGVFYREGKHGFFSSVIYANDSVHVSVKDILRDCRDNKPAYQTFHLQRVFDVDSASDLRKWEGLRQSMNDIRVDLAHLELLTPALNNHLYDLLEVLGVNFTSLRTQLTGSVTGKDLNSFAIQLDSVGNQIRDSATASRMEVLSSRTRRLIQSDIQPLEEKRDALIYQLTALEVQVTPLERRVNQSLYQLKTIQFYINTRGEEIADRKTKDYVERLNSYIKQFREHVMKMAHDKVAPCKPVWTLFHYTRLLFCKHIMDPLNGYWLATMWCLIIFLIATPVCLKLVDYYRLKGNCHSRSSGSPSESLVVAEQGRGWSTPGEAGDAGTW